MRTARQKFSAGIKLGMGLMFVLIALGFSGTPARAATIVVDTTADDDTVNGNCTLREAMIAARDNGARDTCLGGGTIDTISFNINASTDPGCNAGTGVCTIQPTTDLPDLYGSGNITIDGYSQPGATPATGGTPADIRIVLDGSLDVDASPYGFYIASPDNIIQGLAINQFSSGIVVGGAPAMNNTIQGCYIGTDATGMVDLGNTSIGIWLSQTGIGNQVGGTVAEHRNVISGNNWQGIDLGSSTTGTTISGNYVGTTANGLSALPNGNGISFRSSAHGNTIGGSDPGAVNVISGNTGDGIVLNGATSTPHGNTIEGNFIGVNATGSAALANGASGVEILNGAFANTIGPDNIISGNTQQGVLIWTIATNENMVIGNYIGTDSTGTAAIPNASTTAAVFINKSSLGAPLGTVIGGDTPDERNLISGNAGQGVRISGEGTNLTVITGNFIGLDITGTTALLNGYEGVAITNGAANTTVGGDTNGEGNVIVADYAPIKLDVGAHHNTVSGNLLGTDVTGTTGFGTGTGVSIGGGAHDNIIGGPTIGERNVISGNGGRGLNISGLGTDNNQVLGNFIGVDVTGANPLPNPSGGIQIWDSARGNTIGPKNIIANNGLEGIRIYGVDTDFNIFTQNSIYAHTNYNIALPYTPDGSNEDIVAPEITSVNFSPLSVSGTTTPTCVGCTIEVFTSLSDYPAAGRSYLGTGTTDGSGNWTVSTPGLHGPYISATLTDATKGTSKYSNRIFTTIQSLYLPLIMR